MLISLFFFFFGGGGVAPERASTVTEMCQIKDGELPAMVKKRAVKIASISSDLIFQNELSNMYQFFFIVFQSYLNNKLLLRISDRTAGD